jgi:hypothetical protein
MYMCMDCEKNSKTTRKTQTKVSARKAVRRVSKHSRAWQSISRNSRHSPKYLTCYHTKVRVPLLNHRVHSLPSCVFCSPVHHRSAIYVASNGTFASVASRLAMAIRDTCSPKAKSSDRVQPPSDSVGQSISLNCDARNRQKAQIMLRSTSGQSATRLP